MGLTEADEEYFREQALLAEDPIAGLQFIGGSALAPGQGRRWLSAALGGEEMLEKELQRARSHDQLVLDAKRRTQP